jgi:hypothetical protein
LNTVGIRKEEEEKEKKAAELGVRLNGEGGSGVGR